jgi:cell division protein FtsX
MKPWPEVWRESKGYQDAMEFVVRRSAETERNHRARMAELDKEEEAIRRSEKVTNVIARVGLGLVILWVVLSLVAG